MMQSAELLLVPNQSGRPQLYVDGLLDGAPYEVGFNRDGYSEYLASRNVSDEKIEGLVFEMHRHMYKPVPGGTYNFRDGRMRMCFEPAWKMRKLFDPTAMVNRVLLHETEHFIQDAMSDNGVRDMNFYRQLGGLAGLALYRQLRGIPENTATKIVDAAAHVVVPLAGTNFLNPLEIAAEISARRRVKDEDLHFLSISAKP